MSGRVGLGFDIHRFSDDAYRRLVLGGVHIEGAVGLDGHSDADVVSHAITDAILGAAGLGDIGEHFPDTDPLWKDADSIAMLNGALKLVIEKGWIVENVDCTVVLERPRIAPHRAAMQARLTSTVGAPVSVKAGRAEGLGSIGRVEGAACWAVALLTSTSANGDNQ
jgi:2-C-methyl-D-erythritol 2,4-cyclodiphosphate synthase